LILLLNYPYNTTALRIINKHILAKLVKKNAGNTKLLESVKRLLDDLESGSWNSPMDLIKVRPDADCVYGGSFFVFNIRIHRVLILIEFEEDGEATIVWAGGHDDYESTFKNNRSTIKKWLRNNDLIK
jgi:mRNA-degrading endonuclease HigB of HigAB toxin-antitoxin module